MRHLNLSKKIDASRQVIWDILADFPNVADWNRGVKKSHSTSDAASGVGASRHCDLAPVEALEETIREWEPNERMAISIDAATKAPIKGGLGTFVLTGDDAGPTEVALQFDYRPKAGPIGNLFNKLLDKRFMKGFHGYLDDLDSMATEPSIAYGATSPWQRLLMSWPVTAGTSTPQATSAPRTQESAARNHITPRNPGE